MAKKKKSDDDKQTSLFSFVDKPAKKAPKKQAKKKQDKPIEEKPESKVKEEKKPKEKKQIKKDKTTKEPQDISEILEEDIESIPDEFFFEEEEEEDFALQEGDIDLEDLKREGLTTKYLRYLVEKGEIVQDLEKGLLLDVDYDGGQNKAYCKFYDLEAQDIKIWIDTTNHEAYCLSKASKQELENNIKLTNYDGFVRFEEVKRMDLLKDKEIELVKIYGRSPTDIGGRGENIKNILQGEAWEADIRYHHNYIYDTGFIPGMIYSIEKGKVKKIDYYEDKKDYEKMEQELVELFKEEPKELQDFAKKNVEIFLTPIPDAKRMAMDIEVEVGDNEYRVPDPRLAKQAVISVSFVASDGMKKVYILEREGFSYKPPHKNIPDDTEIKYFASEKKLLIETFRLMWEYPILITFNGDNFDLNYLYHRANKKRISKDLNPIQVKRGFGFMSSAECELRKGIHIDVFNFFFNRSISGYAFGGAYETSSLNNVSAALLSQEKYQHEEEIHDMQYDVLAWYNLKDSILTLELTQFNNSLVWNLIILLCRMTKLPIHDMLRHQISTWIKSIFHFEHRQEKILIPRRSEITALKKGGYSKSTIEGKGFKGAYVIKPVPGAHYNVVVMDFASLYPSIIKEYNLSYETVQCPHEGCKDNLIKGIPYYVCTQKMGIFAYVVGFFRDIRVKYFKPKSGDKSLDEQKRSYFMTIQQALKVFINGSYGVFGSKNFPLFCLPVAESTTGIGRYSIKATIDKAESMGIQVLYGDSDSVFLAHPSEKQLKEISEWSKQELDLDLEEEKTYQFLALSKRKKNYIGIYKDSKYIDIKGLVAKKRNTPDLIKNIFGKVTQILKEITNDEEFEQAKKEIVEIIRENRKKIGRPNAFDLEDYAIKVGIKKSLDKYDKVLPQHVRAAKDLEMRTGKQYQKGDVISLVKTKGVESAKALEIADFKDIDIKKYQELLKSALEQVLDALGVSYDEVKGIRKMDSFF